MTTPLFALIGFVFWTLLLLGSIGATRVAQVIGGTTPITGFTAGVPHGGDAYWRLNRAHLNCVENLPIFAAVVLAAAAAGYSSETFDTLARVYVTARVGQSVVHISSGSAVAINVRFTFFLVQIVCVAWMALSLV